MKEWFSGIVRGKTTDSRGKDKKVRHLFIVDATGFTEAENVLVADKFPVYKEPKVISLKREAIEAVYDECDTESAVWWKVVIGLEWLDVKGRTKVSKCTYMVSSETAGDVKDVINKCMQGSVGDWKILKIEATQVREIIVHKEKHNDELR